MLYFGDRQTHGHTGTVITCQLDIMKGGGFKNENKQSHMSQSVLTEFNYFLSFVNVNSLHVFKCSDHDLLSSTGSV